MTKSGFYKHREKKTSSNSLTHPAPGPAGSGKYYENTCKLANPSGAGAEAICKYFRKKFHFPLLFIFSDFSQIILIPSRVSSGHMSSISFISPDISSASPPVAIM